MHFKKQISLFIAFFVLVSNSGLAFNVHYCQDKIASISSVFSNKEVCDLTESKQSKQLQIIEKNCCAKVEQTHKKCCSDKKISIKSKTEKTTIETNSFNLDLVFNGLYSNLNLLLNFPSNYFFQNNAFYCYANAPPFYQLYCQYTFYA